MVEQIKKRIPHKSIKIGYLLHNMLQAVSMEYFNGIYQAAYDNNINLIIEGIGGHLKNRNEHHYDINFSMLNILDRSFFDGIIVWGSALNSIFFDNNDALLNFLEKFKSIPIVNIGLKLFNNPTVMTDNIEGIKKVLKHLIEDHGYKNIAFLKGPENHISDIQRYDTYLKTLEQYGLPINKKLISPPCLYIIDQIHSSSNYFIEKIKNKELIPGKNIDVIVASNDHFAIELLNQLKNAGIKVPDDIAVTGFDDINESQLIEPNLTTINSNLFQIGYKAMEILIDWINNREINKSEIYMPSELIVRRSCGCNEQSLIKEKKIDSSYIINNEKSFKNFINSTFRELINEKLNNLNQKQLKESNTNLIYKLFDNFISDITRVSDNQFISWL
ncbi:MAG: substrate-binding domain-containing protein, partial [Spirochaetes bacterium]|nr:substrate-binding domain-containing protein [Spirochaetota bacterium]